MEWSSDTDSSFGSSLNPTSSKEDYFSTSQISSTSDVDIKLALGLQIDPVLRLSSSMITNPSSFPSPMCSPFLPKDLPNCRKSKILPPSLLLSVTKKVRDGTVSKSEISSTTNDLKTFSSPCCLQNGSANKLLLPQTQSPLSVNSSLDSPFRLVNNLDSNISDIDSNSSQLAIKLEVSEDSDDKGLSATSDTSICTIYSDDETRNKLKVEKPRSRIPNYFISIQFSDPEIYRSLKEVHKSVMKKNGNYSLAVVPLHSLHMTLAVMRLENEEDMARAKSALNRCGNELRPKYRQELLELPLQGLGNFRHSVVFAKVRPGEHVAKLEEIADVVQKEFCEEGLVDDKHNFTPHVTVLKLSRVGKKLTKKTGLKKIYPDIYEEAVDTYFGTQQVHSLQLCSMLKAKDITGYYHVEHKIDFGEEMFPDDGGTTPMATVNGERKLDSLSETTKESATRSKNPGDTILQYSTFTNMCSSEKKMKLDCDVSLNNMMYKSETFIYVSQEKTVADNSRAQILTTTLPEVGQNDNISSTPINFSENMLTSDKFVDDDQEIKLSLEVTKKLLEKEAKMSNYETSPGEAPMQEAVSHKTYSSYNTAIPTLIVTQPEAVADKPTVKNITDTGVRVTSTAISLKEASPSTTTISDSTGDLTLGMPATFQDITLNDTGVSDVSGVVETAAQVSAPSCDLPNDLELAEEATEGLVSNDSIGLSLGNDQSDGHNSVCNKIREDNIETIESLNIVPPFMKKRRKKIGKCSVM